MSRSYFLCTISARSPTNIRNIPAIRVVITCTRKQENHFLRVSTRSTLRSPAALLSSRFDNGPAGVVVRFLCGRTRRHLFGIQKSVGAAGRCRWWLIREWLSIINLCVLLVLADCPNCVEDNLPTPNRWTMPLLKLGEKRYYLGIFFKVGTSKKTFSTNTSNIKKTSVNKNYLKRLSD